MSELFDRAAAWRNDNDYNTALHLEFSKLVDADLDLKAHRDWVEQRQHGFGDRPFHWLWKLLVDEMPDKFSFLEVGVFKGQVLSLISLLARRASKAVGITGVTTLANTPDVRCKYPDGNYYAWIWEILEAFRLPTVNVHLAVGKSQSPSVLDALSGYQFDIVYIDGSHDYQVVVEDLKNYGPMVKLGGFFVIDDSSNLLNIGTCWPGLEEVSQAVRDVLEPNPNFKHLLACGHLRVFQKENT